MSFHAKLAISVISLVVLMDFGVHIPGQNCEEYSNDEEGGRKREEEDGPDEEETSHR